MTSSAERNSQEESFLVDFLYADLPRLAVLAAQLFDDGNLVGVKKSSQSGVDSLLKIKGGVPGVAGGETSSTDKIQESIERQFDASWAVPLNVLKELNKRDFLIDDLDGAAFGQIVLVRGGIYVADVRMLQKLWKPIVKVENAKAFANAKSGAEQKKIREAAKETEDVLNMVELLPHSLQFRISNDEVGCWATLDPEQLTINPADLAFKHGPTIPGEWVAIGVLDAKPNTIENGLLASVKNLSNPLQIGMAQVLSGLRQGFGRPEGDYGFTPLVIYRPID
ncbi:hypothetical protein [Comamonas sp.]|uniref:hypothetical protein n=1 Tax=Comamonas sp. TaxID=34028 RepID=UPI0025856303|nr:hypothetical protein [Comamonas sp.]